MGNSFNTEAKSTLVKAKEQFEIAKDTMKKGVEKAVEVAEESNVPKLIRSANAMQEACTALDKTMEEVLDCIDKAIEYYNDLDESLS